MADVHKFIRSALETQLANVAGNPQIAYEGVSFVPTTGTSYLQVVFDPVSRRPAVRGLNPQQRYDGIFLVLSLIHI